MDYLIYVLQRDPSTAIISEEDADTDLEMVRLPARDTRDRRLVPEHPDPGLRRSDAAV